VSETDAPVLAWIAAVGLGYLLGSIPFGLVLARLGGYGDIRKIGSGNIGATNVLRTGNKSLAFFTLVLDTGKGGAAVVLAAYAAQHHGYGELAFFLGVIAGVAAVFGHNFPVWLGFRGGKGVATTLGTLLTIAWPVGLAACVTWLIVAVISRISSLSALVALSLSPVYAWFLVPVPYNAVVTYAAAVLGVLSIIRHRANIKRILAGEEPKIGKKKQGPDPAAEPPTKENENDG